jgi:hypothetical protein
MAVADYEAALQVLRSARNALERSPTTAAKLGEEDIRNLLLVTLNAHFEGAAGGELFNGLGKTDILIRVDDGNVFIAECKVIGPRDGPAKIVATIDQLLGYMTWRDTKGAVLLFIRNREVSAVVKAAVEAFEGHSNFKRGGPGGSHERHDFVFHANGDPAKEVSIALMPFVIPS